jgi:GMP synthase (glutamine-hydrolysing)
MAASPFLLLQSRDPGDAMRRHEVECFVRALGISPGELSVTDVLERVPDARELRDVSAVLMGGSGDYSSLDAAPWIDRMVAWIRDVLLPSDVPVFASCFGFQVMVRALGGTMLRDPARREVGSFDIDLAPGATDDPLFGALPPRFVGQVGHTDRAQDLPPGTVLLASSPRCPVHAYRVGRKPVWATQFHPELSVEDVRVRYLRYLEKYPPEDLPTGVSPEEAPFLKSLRDSPEATALLPRFAELVRSGVP